MNDSAEFGERRFGKDTCSDLLSEMIDTWVKLRKVKLDEGIISSQGEDGACIDFITDVHQDNIEFLVHVEEIVFEDPDSLGTRKFVISEISEQPVPLVYINGVFDNDVLQRIATFTDDLGHEFTYEEKQALIPILTQLCDHLYREYTDLTETLDPEILLAEETDKIVISGDFERQLRDILLNTPTAENSMEALKQQGWNNLKVLVDRFFEARDLSAPFPDTNPYVKTVVMTEDRSITIDLEENSLEAPIGNMRHFKLFYTLGTSDSGQQFVASLLADVSDNGTDDSLLIMDYEGNNSLDETSCAHVVDLINKLYNELDAQAARFNKDIKHELINSINKIQTLQAARPKLFTSQPGLMHSTDFAGLKVFFDECEPIRLIDGETVRAFRVSLADKTPANELPYLDVLGIVEGDISGNQKLQIHDGNTDLRLSEQALLQSCLHAISTEADKQLRALKDSPVTPMRPPVVARSYARVTGNPFTL